MADNHINNEDQNQEALNHLRSAVVDKLGWAQGAAWNGTDFERLSDLVSDETGKRLSVSTLKDFGGERLPTFGQAEQPWTSYPLL